MLIWTSGSSWRGSASPASRASHGYKFVFAHECRVADPIGDIAGLVANAWRAAGLPMGTWAGAQIEIVRQVHIALGVLILLGVLLGFTADPRWYALTAVVGAGLAFAGVTGRCGMAAMCARRR